MNSSFSLGILACSVFFGMALAVVVITAVEYGRLESEPLPQRKPSPQPQDFMPCLWVPYVYLRFQADAEAAWCMQTATRMIYSAN